MLLYISVCGLFVSRYLIESDLSRRGGQILIAIVAVIWISAVCSRREASHKRSIDLIAGLAALFIFQALTVARIAEGTEFGLGITEMLTAGVIPLLFGFAAIRRPSLVSWSFPVSITGAALITLCVLGALLGMLGAPSVAYGIEATGSTFGERARMAFPLIYGVVPAAILSGLAGASFVHLLTRSQYWRVLAVISIVVSTAIIYLSGTRSGFVLLAIAFLSLIFRTNTSRSVVKIVSLVLVLIPLVTPYAYAELQPSLEAVEPSALTRIQRPGETSAWEMSGRAALWDIAAPAAVDRALSLRPVAFGENDAGIAPLLAEKVGVFTWDSIERIHSHNTPLNLIFGGGLLLLGSYFVLTLIALNRSSNLASPRSRSVFQALIAWLIISCIESLFWLNLLVMHVVFFALIAESFGDLDRSAQRGNRRSGPASARFNQRGKIFAPRPVA